MKTSSVGIAVSIACLASFANGSLLRADGAAARLVGRALGPTPLLSDLRELTDGIGGRPTGSAALERAVDWGARKFKALGIDVRTEAYSVPTLWLGQSAEAECTAPESFGIPVAAAPFTPGTAAGGLVARLVDAGDGSPEAYARLGVSAKGAIALVSSTEMRTLDDLFADYMHEEALLNAARSAGVSGLLLQSNHVRGLLYRHPMFFAVDFPVAVVGREAANRLLTLAAKSAVTIRLKIANQTGGAYTTRNVVAEIKGREKPEEIVLIGAHLDSWDLGTGANDNGVNAALVLDVARGMKELGLTPRRTVRFVLFTGEEQGMNGSAAYVQSHAAELDNHVAMAVFDEGSGRTTGFFLGGHEEMRQAVDEALAPVAGLGPFEQPPDAFDGTDNFDFLLSGIPNLLANQDAAPYIPDYHASSDTFDKVDPREAQANVAIASALVWGLAERPDRIGRRQSRSEVEQVLRTYKMEEQMRAFAQWSDWLKGARGVNKK